MASLQASQSFPVKVHVAESGPLPIKIDSIALKTSGTSGWGLQARGSTSASLDGDSTFDALFDVHVAEDAGYTRPYFELPSIEQPYYDLRDPQYRGMPLAPYPLEAWVTASYQGVQIHVGEVVQTIQREVGPGIVFHPMPVGRASSVTKLQALESCHWIRHPSP